MPDGVVMSIAPPNLDVPYRRSSRAEGNPAYRTISVRAADPAKNSIVEYSCMG